MMVSLLPVPALLIKMSTPPNDLSTSATRRVMSSALDTSALIPMALTPYRALISPRFLGQARLVPGAQHEMHPFLRQPFGDGQADADAPAGDDGDFILRGPDPCSCLLVQSNALLSAAAQGCQLTIFAISAL